MNRQQFDNLRKRYATFGRGRSQRLMDYDYSTPNQPFYVTVCTKGALCYLNNPQLHRRIVEEIEEAVQMLVLRATILCVMPNHYHWLFALTESSGTDLSNVIKRVNGLTGHFAKRILGHGIWQRGFYDHIVRKDEDMHQIAQYIAENPRRWRDSNKSRREDLFTVKWFV